VIDPANVGWRRSLHFLASRRRWRAYGRQFVPSLLSAMLNGWQYQVISFIAAKMGGEEIAAHNCALALFEISHALAVGMADSAAVRVGYHLGRGDAAAAKKAAIAAAAGAAAIGLAFASTGILLRQYMGRIFSNDPAIVDIVASLANPFWLAFLCLFVGTVLLQVLAGQGRVRIQSAVYLVSGYVVAVPFAFISFYRFHQGLQGLWAGLLCGNVVLLVLALILVARSDWAGLAAFACAQQDAPEPAAAADTDHVAATAGLGGGVASHIETRAEGLLRELEDEDEPAELDARVQLLRASAPAGAQALPPAEDGGGQLPVSYAAPRKR
jgi:MATE family multidrug resistance protein